MKIIHTDNFGGDFPDEEEVTNLPKLNKEALRQIADLINKLNGGKLASRYYKVVEDDYQLRGGFEP